MPGELMAAEIAEQPTVLAASLAAGRGDAERIAGELRARWGEIDFIMIAARGTSDNAARYAQYLFGAMNRLPVALATPSLFTLYNTPPDLAAGADDRYLAVGRVAGYRGGDRRGAAAGRADTGDHQRARLPARAGGGVCAADPRRGRAERRGDEDLQRPTAGPGDARRRARQPGNGGAALGRVGGGASGGRGDRRPGRRDRRAGRAVPLSRPPDHGRARLCATAPRSSWR